MNHAEPSPWRILIPLFIGANVALGLGAWAQVHSPSGVPFLTLPLFSTPPSAKVWLATVAMLLACFQAGSALRMYGRLGGNGPAPAWLKAAHRWSGRLAILLSIPIAYHCLFALGLQTYSSRVWLHSILGCVLYGAFVAKVLNLRLPRIPHRGVPVFGGMLFATLAAIWATSGPVRLIV